MEVTPIPAFRDNYIWLLQRGGHATVVDPGDAAPVRAALSARNLRLDTILITHHHDDHIGGVADLLQEFPATVYASRSGRYPFPHHGVGEGDTITLDHPHTRLQVMETPGHTLDHVAYYGADSLFCGDTLFSCGCGRVFEGTCQQLYHSLQRLASLPPVTKVYCAHEYTLDNLLFALKVDPDNINLEKRRNEVERLRSEGKPSLPSSIALELTTNPFLRCDSPAIQSAAKAQTGVTPTDSSAAFCTLRIMKNSF